MEGNFPSAVEGDREQSRIFELPQAMQELIFVKLSLQSISSCRMVCKEWNSILSSHSFLFSLPTQNPWLLISGKDYCMAYCFSTQKWRAISLSFPPETEGSQVSTTALGLLLFLARQEIIFLPGHYKASTTLYVCNPLIGIYSEIKFDNLSYSRFIVQGRNGKPYLVVTLARRNFSTQIYHYFQDSWRIKFEFSEEGIEGSLILHREMVECNGVLFWRARTPSFIVGYNIKDDDSIKRVRIAPLPYQLVEDANQNKIFMVAYGLSVLLVDLVGMGMVIWELFQDDEDELLWKWKEFARMPPHSLPQYFGGNRFVRECVAVGDYLCFDITEPYNLGIQWRTLVRYLRFETNIEPGTEWRTVVAYNLREGFWQCLLQHRGNNNFSVMLSFHPKLIFVL